MTLEYLDLPIVTLNKLDRQNNTANEQSTAQVLLSLEFNAQIDRLCLRATTDTEPGIISLYLSPPGGETAYLISQTPVNKHKKTPNTGVWEMLLDQNADPIFPLKLKKGFRLLAQMTCRDLDVAFDVTLLGGTFRGRTTPLYQDRYLFERGALGEKHLSAINPDDLSAVYLPMTGKGHASSYRIDKVFLVAPSDKWPLPSQVQTAQENIATIDLIVGQEEDPVSNTITAINLKNNADGLTGARDFIDHGIRPDLFPFYLPVSHYLGIRSGLTKTLKQLQVFFSGGYIDE